MFYLLLEYIYLVVMSTGLLEVLGFVKVPLRCQGSFDIWLLFLRELNSFSSPHADEAHKRSDSPTYSRSSYIDF